MSLCRMAKLLLEIFVGFVVSTSVLFGEELCSHYDDEDCVHPNAVKNGYYTNQWSVYMPGISKDEAKQLFEDNGFDYLGQVIIIQTCKRYFSVEMQILLRKNI